MKELDSRNDEKNDEKIYKKAQEDLARKITDILWKSECNSVRHKLHSIVDLCKTILNVD